MSRSLSLNLPSRRTELTQARREARSDFLVLDGREAAGCVLEYVRSKVEWLAKRGHTVPTLCIILVGNEPASRKYVNNKVRQAQAAGINARIVELPASVSQAQLVETIRGEAEFADGIIVQMPLPVHLSADEALLAIPPEKDVDCLHPDNVGLLAVGVPRFVPATPLGIVFLLRYWSVDVSGKHVVVVGRSRLVGTPLALLLSRNAPWGNASVTIVHSRSEDVRFLTVQADVLVVAAGRHRLVDATWVSPWTVVVDVGIHVVEGEDRCRRVEGDVAFEEVARVARACTPVPGGVGPMTVASLLFNVTAAALAKQGQVKSYLDVLAEAWQFVGERSKGA